MKKRVKPDIAGVIDNMRQQLASLEKKIDILIGRTSSRPFDEKNYLRSAQPADQPPRYAERKQENRFRERVLHKAICADCRKECEVPFKPSPDRPVYCKECFSKRKNGGTFNAKPYKEPEKKKEDIVQITRKSAAAKKKSSLRHKKKRS